MASGNTSISWPKNRGLWGTNVPTCEVSEAFWLFLGKNWFENGKWVTNPEPRSELKLPILSLCPLSRWNRSLGDKCWIDSKAEWLSSKEEMSWWFNYRCETGEKRFLSPILLQAVYFFVRLGKLFRIWLTSPNFSCLEFSLSESLKFLISSVIHPVNAVTCVWSGLPSEDISLQQCKGACMTTWDEMLSF